MSIIKKRTITELANCKTLFIIPFTIYFICWDGNLKRFYLSTKQFDPINEYYFQRVE